MLQKNNEKKSLQNDKRFQLKSNARNNFAHFIIGFCMQPCLLSSFVQGQRDTHGKIAKDYTLCTMRNATAI